MSKILRVLKPFFTLEPGDTLELSNDGKNYAIECDETFDRSEDKDGAFSASYKSEFVISVAYAKELIEEGVFECIDDTPQPFINVFDEINSLLSKYTEELNNIDNLTDAVPACVKVEKTTVLRNLITVLTHLKNLKK